MPPRTTRKRISADTELDSAVPQALPEALNETTHISAPSRILSKRPRQASRSHRINPALKAWNSFEALVNKALLELRKPAADAIIKSLHHVPSNGEVVAVCVTMGAAAAAGDRTDIFTAVIDRIETEITHVRVLRFHSAQQATVSSFVSRFEEMGDTPIVVAVEDADMFPDTLLRDLVYLCGKRRASSSAVKLAARGKPPVAMVLGLGTSAAALHSALGIQEATMIAPALVEMPDAATCFKTIVEKVLSSRRHGVLLSRDVFERLETEFFTKETTVSMLLRSLKLVFTLHYYRFPSAQFFCIGRDRETHVLVDPAVLKNIEDGLNESDIKDISHKIESAACHPHLPSHLYELREKFAEWFGELCRWKALCYLLQTIFKSLLLISEVEELQWKGKEGISDYHSYLELHLFKTFLVKSASNLAVYTNPFGAILKRKISAAGRAHLLKVVDAINTCVADSLLSDDKEVKSLCSQLEDLGVKLKNYSGNDVEPSAHENRRASARKPMAKGAGAARARRQAALLEASQNAVKSSPIGGYREDLLSIFDKFVALVKPLSDLPLYESILFSSTADLQKYSGGMGGCAEPRSSLFIAMRQPSKILGSLPPNQHPDTAVAYRILAEGGRLVSLYDWYNSFAAMLTAGRIQHDEDGNVIMDPISTAELQGRFGKACSELEFLGFLKYTNRKTDHVARLAFE